MKIIDISMPVSSETPLWPGDPKVELARYSKIEEGDGVNVSRISMSVHTGTHVDAPYHFFQKGAKVDTLPLDVLIGKVQVVYFDDGIEEINASVIEKQKINWDINRIIFKTHNSIRRAVENQEFDRNYVALTADGAEYLVDKNIRLVGIDYLSIGLFTRPIKTHKILLKAGVIILEGLNLADVSAGEYELICLPVKLVGADGAPARAVLIA
jgi:arylformamidase